MKMPLKIFVAIFAFCAGLIIVQSCGNNTPNRFSKGPKSVNDSGKTNTPTTGQVTPSQTQTTGTSGSATIATGTVSTGIGSNLGSQNVGPGAAAELPPAASGSSNSQWAEGTCVDDDGCMPNGQPVDDASACCVEGTDWVCYESYPDPNTICNRLPVATTEVKER